ncbi:MAG: DUF1345 domain-containing protein [Novosphingobium sp.]
MSQRTTLGNRLAPPRFLVFLGLLGAGFTALWATGSTQTRAEAAILAFDLAAVVFLASLVPLLYDSSAAAIRRHARENDANRVLVLLVTVVLTLVALAAIGGEMPRAKAHEALATARLIGTLLLIWLFANTVFALHYAHAYYSAEPGAGKDAGGIAIPSAKTPDYADFAYFAFTLGMTFQTSDVAITAPAIRRVALLHCFAAFVFNLGVIAFTINALSGS